MLRYLRSPLGTIKEERQGSKVTLSFSDAEKTYLFERLELLSDVFTNFIFLLVSFRRNTLVRYLKIFFNLRALGKLSVDQSIFVRSNQKCHAPNQKSAKESK